MDVGRFVRLRQGGTGGIALGGGGVQRGLCGLDVGSVRCADVCLRRLGGGEALLEGEDLGLEAAYLALHLLGIRNAGGCECRQRGPCRSQQCLVGLDRTLGRLSHVRRCTLLQEFKPGLGGVHGSLRLCDRFRAAGARNLGKPCLGRCESVLGGVDVLGAPALLQLTEPEFLLLDGEGCARDVVGLAARLNLGKTCLGGIDICLRLLELEGRHFRLHLD